MKTFLKLSILALAVITIKTNDVDWMTLKFLNKNNNQSCLIDELRCTSIGCTCEVDECICPSPIFEALKKFEVRQCSPPCHGRCYCSVGDKCICRKKVAGDGTTPVKTDECANFDADCNDRRLSCWKGNCMQNGFCYNDEDCFAGTFCSGNALVLFLYL
jgi:hypothetical protein